MNNYEFLEKFVMASMGGLGLLGLVLTIIGLFIPIALVVLLYYSRKKNGAMVALDLRDLVLKSGWISILAGLVMAVASLSTVVLMILLLLYFTQTIL